MVDEHVTHEADEALAALLGAHALEDEVRIARGRTVARERLTEAMSGGRMRSRRRRSAWLVPAVATLTLVGGGAAIAQTTGIADRILGSDRPANERIEALREPGDDAVSDPEVALAAAPFQMPEEIGDPRAGFTGASVVDERGGYRVRVFETTPGAVLSTLQQQDGPDRWRNATIASIEFPDAWPVSEAHHRDGEVDVYHGIVADGVEALRFTVAGRSVDADLVRGTYLYWPADGTDADAIEVTLVDGTVMRRDLRHQREVYEALDRAGGVVQVEPALPEVISGPTR